MKRQFPRKKGYYAQARSKNMLIEVVHSSISHIDLSNVSTENAGRIIRHVRGIASSQLKAKARTKNPINKVLIIGRTVQRIAPIAEQYGAVVNSYFPIPPVPEDKPNQDKPKATVTFKSHKSK